MYLHTLFSYYFPFDKVTKKTSLLFLNLSFDLFVKSDNKTTENFNYGQEKKAKPNCVAMPSCLRPFY